MYIKQFDVLVRSQHAAGRWVHHEILCDPDHASIFISERIYTRAHMRNLTVGVAVVWGVVVAARVARGQVERYAVAGRSDVHVYCTGIVF